MLDSAMKDQLSGIFSGLVSQYVFDIQVAPDHESRQELIDLLGDVASCSDHLSCSVADGEGLQFTIVKDGMPTGIRFRAVPNGHEFTSLLLAVLNSDGKGKNIPDESICARVRALNGPIKLTTYVSLTCTNCPDVVQALNVMAIIAWPHQRKLVGGKRQQDSQQEQRPVLKDITSKPEQEALLCFTVKFFCRARSGAVSRACRAVGAYITCRSTLIQPTHLPSAIR